MNYVVWQHVKHITREGYIKFTEPHNKMNLIDTYSQNYRRTMLLLLLYNTRIITQTVENK